MKLQNGTKDGIIAGAIMALITFGLSIFGNFGNTAWQYLKYIPLAIIIYNSIYYYKEHFEGDLFFPQGLFRGMKISAVAGSIIVAINLILFLINPGYSIEMWSIIPENSLQILAISAFIYMEIFVFGAVISMITMQQVKNPTLNEA